MSLSTNSRRHALGQHFLKDTTIIQKIHSAVWDLQKKKSCSLLLEIGPGKGAITDGMLTEYSKHGFKAFTLVEKDPRLITAWNEKLSTSDSTKLIGSDFLDLNLAQTFEQSAPILVVSNLPYSSGTAILQQLCEFPKIFSGMVLMFQQEVAQRIRAEPNSKSFGSLSLWVQNRWDVTRVCPVPPRAFFPPPKVQSEVVSLEPRAQNKIEGTDSPKGRKVWEELIRAAFAQRRKMLRSSMAKNPKWTQAIADSKINPEKRAESLSWDEWNALFSSAIKYLGIIAIAWGGMISDASANVADLVGYGSRTSALAGAGAASTMDPYLATLNPAALSVPRNKRFLFGYGLTYLEPRFTPIGSVAVENKFTSDALRTGPVDINYKETFGQSIGACYQFDPKWWNLGVGLSLFFPINNLAYIDSGEAYVPEYALYRSRTQRPQVEVAAGAQVLPNLHFGLGLRLAFSLNTNATVFLQTQSSTTSSMRFSSSMKPRLGPYTGLLYRGDKYNAGLVFRAPISSPSYTTMRSENRLIGGLAGIPLKFDSSSAIFYDPMTTELGVEYRHSPFWTSVAQLEYQWWKLYKTPILTLDGVEGVSISTQRPFSETFRNIWVPKLAQELHHDAWTLRFGYSYRPTILESLPGGAGNIVDPPQHRFTAGAGWLFKHFFEFEVPTHLDVHAAYYQLISQEITKSAGNEYGDTSDSKIGSPSYKVGGKMYGGGVSLTLEL